MFYSVNTKNLLEEQEFTGNGTTISSSGLYEITINNAIVKYNNNNARTIWLQYTLKDSTTSGGMLFIRLDNNDGSRNFQASSFEKLLICCGITQIGNLVQKDITTKKGTNKESCIQELTNKKVIVWVRASYKLYNNEIQEALNIIDVFRVNDKGSFKEILENTQKGIRYEFIEKEGLSQITDYKDNLTEKDIENWKSNRMSNSSQFKDNNTNIQTFSIEQEGLPFDLNNPFE